MLDFVSAIVRETGYAGVFLLMLAENVFPPLPSELIMPLAGFAAARGDLHIAGVGAAGMAGSVVGALLWYYAGWKIGLERLERLAQRGGRWMAVTPDELEQATAWFRRHGGKSVLLGRLVPTARTLVSVPAGITAMDLGRFLLYTAIGSALWTGALAAAGYVLEDQYARIGRYIDPIASVVFGLIAAAYLYRVLTSGWRTKKQV